MEVPLLQFVVFLDRVVDISVVVQRQIPMVLFRIIEILQLQYIDKVIDVPVVPVQFPSAGVEKTAELPHCSRRALDKVVGMPVCATTSARGVVLPFTGPDALHHGRYGQKYSYALGSGCACRFCW